MQMQEQYKLDEQKEIDEAEKLAAENEKEGLDEFGNPIPVIPVQNQPVESIEKVKAIPKIPSNE
jgi:hypothetical protein